MSEKTFTGLYLDRELLDDIARELSEANCRTRNEFINKAIRFYIAHLHCRNNSEVLTPALESVECGADPGHRESTGAGAVQAGSGSWR